MSKLTNYFKEVTLEMAHVTWPTRKQTTLYTAVVILLSLGMALFLGLTDYGLRVGLGNLFN
jgi:preprotein translocase SecE subunit